jgi:nucleoside-diphosphate-sugar epimerase
MSLQNKTVLITGIGGAIGQRLAEIAVQKGLIVKGLQRSPAPRNLTDLGIEIFQGDITDSGIAAQACKGVDIVIHSAAIVQADGDLNEFRRVNVGGALNLANAAKAAGVQTFVQISSVLVYGFQYPNRVTELGPFYTGKNPYCLTKLESDQKVMALNAPPNFGVIVIRPGDVYGPRSIPWVIRPLELMRARKFFLLNNGRGVMNHVYVDNLIDGIFLAIEQKSYGEAFNITDGCETSWKEYYTRLAQLENLPKPYSARAAVAKIATRILPKDWINASPAEIDAVTRLYPYSIDKAQRVLGYKPRISLDEGMVQTRIWLKSFSTSVVSS